MYTLVVVGVGIQRREEEQSLWILFYLSQSPLDLFPSLCAPPSATLFCFRVLKLKLKPLIKKFVFFH